MSVLWTLAAFGQVIQMPAYSPPESAVKRKFDPSQLSLVVATSVKQKSPQPLCARPDCTSLFLSTYKNARTLAGIPLAKRFAVRQEMGSPYNMPYRLVLVIAQRPGKESLVLATRGFHYQTGEACFANGELNGIDWKPQGAGISYKNGVLCVRE